MSSVTHISEAEAARDLPGLFERVGAGEQLVIELSQIPPVLMVARQQPVVPRSF